MNEELAVEGARIVVLAMERGDLKTVMGRLPSISEHVSVQWVLGSGRDIRWVEEELARRLAVVMGVEPKLVEELRVLVALPGPREPVAHNAVSGGTAENVVQAGSIGSLTVNTTTAAGDHVDLRGSRFHGPVVGAEHHHYAPHTGGELLDPADWPLVEGADPFAFGVRRARRLGGEAGLPPYVERDQDARLGKVLKGGGLIVVTGEPLSGKSRTAWEIASARAKPGTRVYAPAHGTDLRGLPALLRGHKGRYFLLLDDLEGHLGEHGVTPALLIQLGELRVPVMATMNDEAFDTHRFGGGPASRVLSSAETVGLARRWSEAELGRLAQASDPRLTDARMWRGDHGVTEYLALGPELRDLWRRAARAGSPHPRGHLLVRAAIDLARCGVTGDVPVKLLKEAASCYGDAEVAEAERESAEEAFAWAAERRHGVTGLLARGAEFEGEETWRAFGSLVADALRDDSLPAVPASVWHCAIEETGYDGDVRNSVWTTAHSFFAPRAEAGDAEAMYTMGRLGGAAGDETKSLDWFRRAVDAGKTGLSGYVGHMFLAQGDPEKALPYLRAAVERDPLPQHVRRLGEAHRLLAEQYLRTAAEAGDGAAAHRLGDMLGAVNAREAFTWYTRAAEAGHQDVAASLGTMLSKRGDPEEAELWYRRGVDRGDPRAMHNLALMRYEGGHDEEAERLLRRAMKAGYSAAFGTLGGFLVQEQATRDEGEALLREAIARGHSPAEYNLAVLLAKEGDMQEADRWYRTAAAHGNYYATKYLAARTAAQGEKPEPLPDTVEE